MALMNRLEFERLAWPVASLVLLAVSFLCLIIAIGTPGWVQLDVYMENNFRGTVTFGLIQGMETLTGNVVAELSENYVIFDRFGEILSFIPIYFTLICAIVAIFLCIGAASFTFVNTYQVVEQWWKGPATVYVLSLLITAFAVAGLVSFFDFFQCVLSAGDQLIRLRGSIFLDMYTSSPKLYYSAYLFIAGSILPIFVVLSSWRLTVLMPLLYDEDILEKFDSVPPLPMELDDLEEIDEELVEEEVTTQPATAQRPELSYSTFIPPPSTEQEETPSPPQPSNVVLY